MVASAEAAGRTGDGMTLEDAREQTINYITHSTSCCFGRGVLGEAYVPNPDCPTHTAAWIEREAAERVKNAAEGEEFHREWTSKLGDLVPKLSARKVGERLVELGLRVSHYDARTEKDTYRASAAALDEDYARIVEEYGYPKLYWNIERTVAIILDGPTAEQLANWEAVNRNREQYEDELASLDAIIDHIAYLSDREKHDATTLYGAGCSVKTFWRKAVKRAYYDQNNGAPLKLRKLEATTTGQ
jgi:hypothetical protein